MCGRYQAWVDDEELVGIIEREKRGNTLKYFRQEEVFPGTEMPIIYGSYAAIRAHRSKWGIPISTSENAKASKLIINARAESVSFKPMFKEAFENSRALVLASAYYEWSDGIKYTIGNKSPLLMAAIETYAYDERRYVIITTSATGQISRIHHRMPLFIDRDDMDSWLYDVDTARALVRSGDRRRIADDLHIS